MYDYTGLPALTMADEIRGRVSKFGDARMNTQPHNQYLPQRGRMLKP